MTALVTANDVTLGYSGPVIGPLSFSVAPGEVIGLWGPNGCGKSTLLRAVANQARVFSGRLTRRPGLSLGWQAQHPARAGEMPFSGHEYLHYAQAHREAPPPRLATWLTRRVDRLSGGQFQLLSVWAMLGGDADLVLLDEPTNNLDSEGQTVLAGILAAEQGRRAVLLVSHEHGFLARACSRVIEVAAGPDRTAGDTRP